MIFFSEGQQDLGRGMQAKKKKLAQRNKGLGTEKGLQIGKTNIAYIGEVQLQGARIQAMEGTNPTPHGAR